MKMNYAFLVLSFFLTNSSLGQTALPPAYLLTQDFPDSVKSVSMVKLNGENVSVHEVLDLYQGKKVTIDFWASWCRDCIIGLPKLKNLQHKTGDDNVVYVFISLDKEETKWKSAIDRFDIEGEHYRIVQGWINPLSNYINLDWIPRYLVLNEHGRIIMPKAITADDPLMLRLLVE
jgi:thiol-disulfide isomerase/thioredoxin